MRHILATLLLALCIATPCHAAILVQSANGTYIPIATLAAAATAPHAAGKSVLVTTALSAVQSNISSATLHAWPTDRTLRVAKGGSIGNTTIFRYGGDTDGWSNDEKFTGAGRVELTAPVTNPHGWFAAGKPVIINARLTAQPSLISSALTFGASATMLDSYPEWWGVDGIADEVETQKAIDAPSATAWLTAPVYNWADQVFMKASRKKLKGRNISGVRVNSAKTAGTAIAGATVFTTVISYCEISGFYLYGSAATGPAIGLDISTFTNSDFDIQIQLLRTNAVCLYGIGNGLGSAPYYNHIMGEYYGDASSKTQTAIKFLPGAGGFTAGGPNANIIGPINHAQSLDIFTDIVEGNGNLFHDIIIENINSYHFRLNNVSGYVDTGTSTGSNTAITLKDTSATWPIGDDSYYNYGVRITSGTGAGQSRIISTNTADTLTLKTPWAIVPDATSVYAIAKTGATENKFVNIRSEGASADNPDFIYALLGAWGNEFTNIMAGSLGSGLYVRDESGALDNKWYPGSKVCFTETITDPGAVATINVYPRLSTDGGMMLSNFSPEWMSVTANESAPGGTLTAQLDIGASTVMTATTLATTNASLATPSSTGKVVYNGTSNRVFLTVTTGAGFSVTADVVVTWCATVL